MNGPLSLGKTWGLRRLATPEGHFTMVALDQRPPLVELVASKRGIAPADVSFADMLAIKRLLVESLGDHASAMLMDPNFAVPAAIDCMPARAGLVMTLEDHRFHVTEGGRLSHSIKDWSVEKTRRVGADAVKVLAWYRPDAEAHVAAHQREYVRHIGQECRRWDIPYVLELLVYPFPKSGSHTTDYTESPEKLPQLVLDSVREFARPEYGVDLFKLESPLPGATLPERDGGAAQQSAQQWFNDMGTICNDAGKPWVLLSAGVTPAQFTRVLEYAYAGGAHGFLAGRAIWWQALTQHFPDLQACRKALQSEGVATLSELSDLTIKSAHPWKADYSAFTNMRAEGELCASYP